VPRAPLTRALVRRAIASKDLGHHMTTTDNARPDAYSFDVFDTCVTRTHAHPRDLFYELGLRLAPANLTARQRQRFATRFQSQRIRAEKKAHRRALPCRTVTIEEIYEHFSLPKGLAATTEDLIRAELDLECESIYAVPAVISHLDDLREAGHRIIFISDMYLPSSLLAPILRELEVMRDGDSLYVSCDAGVTKHHGQLFQYVLEAERLDASQLRHTGDNFHADIVMAARSNIRTSHWRGGMLTQREAAMAGRRLPRPRARSSLAAMSRRLRLSKAVPAGHDGDPMDHIVHGIIVPFLLAYVAWVLAHAARHGIRRLYFVARDAEIMLRIAETLQGEGGQIELRYLYGSRRAWLPPSIIPGSNDWQRLLIIPGQASSRQDIAARMGLDETTQQLLRQRLSCNEDQWSTHLPHDQASRFLADLMQDPETSALITSSVERERETALSYFRQEGLFDETAWALVDAGWSLNTQAALKRILETGGSAHQAPKGYYVALARDHLGEAQAGVAYPFVSKAGSIFSRRRVIIEHCFLPSTHATTRGYRMDGLRSVPVMGLELRGDAELRYAAMLHEAAVAGARLAAADAHIAATLSEHVSEILANAEALLRHPHEMDARAMSSFGAIADMRHEASFVEPLCRPLGLSDLWRIISMALSKKKNFESPSFMWLEGSLVLSAWYVRAPLRVLLLLDALRNRLKD
jgi:predicted HAD superfamily hydrolase